MQQQLFSVNVSTILYPWEISAHAFLHTTPVHDQRKHKAVGGKKPAYSLTFCCCIPYLCSDLLVNPQTQVCPEESLGMLHQASSCRKTGPLMHYSSPLCSHMKRVSSEVSSTGYFCFPRGHMCPSTPSSYPHSLTTTTELEEKVSLLTLDPCFSLYVL